MNHLTHSVDLKRDNPKTVMETIMKPLSIIKSSSAWIGALAIGLSLASNPLFAQNANQKGWLQNQQLPQNGPGDKLQGGGNGPDPKIKKIRFTKSAEQLGCKHVRFRIRLAIWGEDGLWDDPNNPEVELVTGSVSSLKDTLPKGLSWENVTINGDIVNFPALNYSSVSHDKDTFEITGIKITGDNSDGVGDPNLREWNVVAIAKIDPAEFPAPKIKENQAKMRVVSPLSTFEALSHHFALPDPANWREGTPTKFEVDLTDCDKPEDGGGEPDGEPCIKLEKGEIECEGGPVGNFKYKMPVGPELAGTTIELVSLTPGVVVAPAFQVVPPGGGVLEWDLVGAAKGMTIHLLTNNVKQVGPADFDGLATCCTEEIIIEIPEDIPCDEEEKEPDLKVTKKALVPVCDKNAGDCKFSIRVKNVGDKKFEGPLALDEWQIPEKANISAGPNPNWTCSIPLGFDYYICKHPALTLNPGEFKDLNLSFKPGNAWIGDKIQNCAKLNYTEMGVAPFGDLTNDKDCAEICIKGSQDCPDEEEEKKPELEIRKFHSDTQCLGGAHGLGPCWIIYSIIVHNFGDGDYNGELNVEDNFDVKPDNVEFTPLPPWQCQTVDGKNFDCKHPGINLPAGTQTILTVKAKFNNPGDINQKDIENCVKLEEGEPGKKEDCVTGTLPGPTNDDKADLSIEKSCKPGVLGGKISCRISIRNNGRSTPPGIVRIFDVARTLGTNLPLTAVDVTPDGPEWQCEGAPAPDLVCAINGEHLTPGTIRYFDAKIELPPKGRTRYRNCATAQHEPIAGGEMNLIGKSCVEGGVDIRVEKTGEAICKKGIPCKFDVTIKNVGETDFQGPVKVADALGLGAGGLSVEITDISPPLPCSTQPVAVPFVCSGELNLAAGESQTHQITLLFPEDTGLDDGTKARNCAVVLDGNLGTTKSKSGNQNKAAPEAGDIVGCHEFEIGEADKNQCTPPMVMNDNGVCVCPEGTKWNGRRCVGGGGTTVPPVITDPVCKPGHGEIRTKAGRCVCRKGYIRKGPKLCVPPQQGCTPGRNEYKNRKGQCVCKPGYQRSKNGFCVKPPQSCKPGPNEVKNAKGQCLCKRGYDRNNYGICVKIPQGCKPGRNEVKDNNGRCVCKFGYQRNKRGFCVKRPPVCKLGPNEFRNSQGQCVCKSGYRRNKKGICVKIPTGCKPGPNEVKNAKGQCVCKRGYDRNNYGICVKTPQACKPGRNEIRNNKGQCVCKPGYHRGKGGYCVKKPTGCKPGPNEYKNQKGQCVCKQGYRRTSSGICVKKPDPKPVCSAGKLIKRGKGWYCSCPKGWQRNGLKNGGARCIKPAAKPVCSGGKLIKRGKGWYCACPKGWKRNALKNGGARCTRPVVVPKPPCINGRLLKRGKGYYCACPNGWKRTPIGKGGARCQKLVIYKPKKPVVKKPLTIKKQPTFKPNNKVFIKKP